MLRGRSRGKARKGGGHSEQDNHRWIISYADFITLLFAFFVVMYAISSINEGKYRLLAETMDVVFSNPQTGFSPNNASEITKTYFPNQPLGQVQAQDLSINGGGYYYDQRMNDISRELNTSLKGLVDEEKILIRQTENWIEVEIKASMLFAFGSAQLHARVDEFLKPVAKVLSKFENPIQVEGFTDNVPIQNDLFPSNWELSGARSAAVVRKLIDMGLPSYRMAVVGYGENFPVAKNTSNEGRLENRRVILVISKQYRRQRLLKENSILDYPRFGAPETKKIEYETIPVNSQGLPNVILDTGGIRFTNVPRPKSPPSEPESAPNPNPIPAQ